MALVASVAALIGNPASFNADAMASRVSSVSGAYFVAGLTGKPAYVSAAAVVPRVSKVSGVVFIFCHL